MTTISERRNWPRFFAGPRDGGRYGSPWGLPGPGLDRGDAWVVVIAVDMEGCSLGNIVGTGSDGALGLESSRWCARDLELFIYWS